MKKLLLTFFICSLSVIGVSPLNSAHLNNNSVAPTGQPQARTGSASSSNTSGDFSKTLNSITLNRSSDTTNYTISVSASPASGGTVSGGGTFRADSTQTVMAAASAGYTFVSWTENENVVSTSASYTFTLSSNRNLIANFTDSQMDAANSGNTTDEIGSPLTAVGISQAATLTSNSVETPSNTEPTEKAVAPAVDSSTSNIPTNAGTGLTIVPTFDSTINNDANSAAIQSAINQAVAIYQAKFSDPITVNILFRYSNTDVNGSPLGSNSLAQSNFVIYNISWNTYINALKADAKTANDTTANATLPANALSTNIQPSSAGGRAVGFNTPPVMLANGTIGSGGQYDGIVTLNSAVLWQFTRPTSANNYDFLRSTEHEIDEVLGLGSFINKSNDLRPQDLFSWSAPGVRSTLSSGTRYFSINSGNTNIVGFNQDPNGDFGDWISLPCLQANPYVQNAFSCRGQYSDVTATSPEGINLDVIGYDLGASTAPPNDNFANAQVINGNSGSATGSSVGATKEAGEPNHAGKTGGASIWYQWQAPSSGSVTITTAGSNFDTLLGVYTGSSVGALTTIAGNDDDPGGGVASRVTFNAVAGTNYRIAVDGFNGLTGSITLNWNLTGTCSYSITLSQSFASSGGTGSVTVTASAGCTWTATSSNTSWLVINSGSSGTGNGTVSYSVSSYSGTTNRSAAITVSGQNFTGTHTVTQTPPAQANLTPFQPPGWSNKIVVSKVTGANIDSSPLTTADTLYIDWAVANDGDAPTATDFFSKLYVDGVERSTWVTNPPLNVSSYAYVQDYSIGQLSAGQHTIRIVIDTSGAIAEKSETDNEYIKVINVTVPTAPNLTPFQPTGWSDKIVVSKVAGTNTDGTSLLTIDTLYIDWAVANNGDAPTAATFVVRLYVDGVERETWNAPPPLNQTFYGYVQDYSIGTLSAGQHTIRIVADATGVIAEKNEGDNEYTKAISVSSANPTATVALSSATYSINEGDATGFLVVTVNRTGSNTAAISVDFATSDISSLTPCQTNNSGAASDRCDYGSAAGTVRFAAGDSTPKIIQIPIVNDAYVELGETFTITLRNAQGASLGTSIATATIIDNDAQSATTNPINAQDFFVKQQYIDFLGRVAEPAGFAFWMDRMTNCPAGQVCDRVDTAKRFFESDEFKERGFYVYKLYDALLGRFPLYAEFVSDVARLNGPQTPAEQRLGKDAYLLDFMNKTEFKNLYDQYLTADHTRAKDAGSASTFVDALCNKAGVTPASKSQLIANLQNGSRDPAHTIEDFILTPEINGDGTKFYDRARIVMQYFGFLRRSPDTPGFNFWWNRVATPGSPQFHDYRELVNNFLRSDEYNFRFAFIPAP
jgi:hypothetical protein